ncbi:MAG: hypothetical protein CVV37_07395 [Nitrospira bacterium HGW-Nitrospira-1]|nr:MAG: hypothetical protein CVV37_07395 [Nitrospira bacterium HGW-Nitrospira-1]
MPKAEALLLLSLSASIIADTFSYFCFPGLIVNYITGTGICVYVLFLLRITKDLLRLHHTHTADTAVDNTHQGCGVVNSI